MEKKRSLFGILVIVLVFGLMVASCSNGVSDSVKAIYLAGGSGDGISKTDFINAGGWYGTDVGLNSHRWTFNEDNTATLTYVETPSINATAVFDINAWTVVSNTDPATKNDYPFGYELILKPRSADGTISVPWTLLDDSTPTPTYKTISVATGTVESVIVTTKFYMKNDKTALVRTGYDPDLVLDIQ